MNSNLSILHFVFFFSFNFVLIFGLTSQLFHFPLDTCSQDALALSLMRLNHTCARKVAIFQVTWWSPVIPWIWKITWLQTLLVFCSCALLDKLKPYYCVYRLNWSHVISSHVITWLQIESRDIKFIHVTYQIFFLQPLLTYQGPLVKLLSVKAKVYPCHIAKLPKRYDLFVPSNL